MTELSAHSSDRPLKVPPPQELVLTKPPYNIHELKIHPYNVAGLIRMEGYEDSIKFFKVPPKENEEDDFLKFCVLTDAPLILTAPASETDWIQF